MMYQEKSGNPGQNIATGRRNPVKMQKKSGANLSSLASDLVVERETH
jgi:hypothetical protein